MRRILFTAALVLVLLLLTVIGTAWFALNNESFLKSQLSRIVLKQTGRELTFSGPLEIDLGRETHIDAHGIRFQNAAWAGKAHMVDIGRLQVSIDIPSLWGETIIIPSLALEECSIELLRNDAGEANWDMLPEPKASPEPPAPRTALPVHLLDSNIRDCTLRIDSPQRKRPLSLSVESLGLRIQNQVRVTLEGAGNINGETLALSGWYQPLGAFYTGGSLDHELNATLGGISLQSSGSLEDAIHFTGANITAHLSGPEIAEILEQVGLQAYSKGGFDFRVALNSVEQMTRLEVNGDLGSIQARAAGQLDRLKKPSKGSIDTTLQGENLQVIGQAFGIEGLVADPFSFSTETSFEEDIVRIKSASLTTNDDRLNVTGHIGTGKGSANTALQFDLKSNEIGRWAPVLGQAAVSVGELTIDGTLNSGSDGIFSIDSELLHGQSTLQLAGKIGRLTGPVEPDLKVNFQSENPQPLAALIGQSAFPAVPLSINGSLSKQDQAVEVQEFVLDLAGNRARVNGKVNLTTQKAGSRLEFDIDIKNAYEFGQLFGLDDLPQQAAKITGIVQPEGKGLSFKISDGNLTEISVDLEGLIADLDNPADIEAEFDIRLPSLEIISFLVPETPLPKEPFSASGRISNKKNLIQLDRVDLKLAGAHTRVNGNLNLEKRLAGSKLDVEFDVADLAAFGSVFGVENLPAEQVKLISVLQPKGKGLAFKISDGDMGEIQLEIEGEIKDLENPLGVDANFDIRLPSLLLLSLAIPNNRLLDRPFTAKGRLRNEDVQTRLENLRLTIGQLAASVDGRIGRDQEMDLAISAEGPDASPLSDFLGQEVPAEAFSVNSRVSGNPQTINLSGLDLTMGQSRLGGDLEIGLGDVTRISGRLDSSRLDLGWWDLPEEEAEVQAQEKSDWVFDDSPVLQLENQDLELDLDLKITVLDLGNTVIEDIDLGIVIKQDHVQLNPFSMRGSTGGTVNGAFSVDSRGEKTQLNLDMRGEQLRLGLFAVEGQEIATYPPTDIDFQLSGQGDTQRELASQLNGKTRVFLGNGQVASSGLGFFMGDFLTELFSLLNPFAETSDYTDLDCAVFAADITSGQAAIFPVIINTEQMTILSEGTIDLDTEKIDLSFNTKVRQGLGLSAGMVINPLIKVGGRLASPAIELDPGGAVVKGGLAVATVGLSLVAKSMSDRFLSSKDPCGDAKKEIDKRKNESR